MTVSIAQREISRIDSPSIERGISGSHRVRRLLPSEDFVESDPFLLLMEDWADSGLFGPHPHRGIETVTYVIDGGIDHHDNHGNRGVIGSGEALWLTSGRGIVHDEQPLDGKPVHLLQLWVNLPAASKLDPARFQELGAAVLPVRQEPGAEIRVFSGSSGSLSAPTLNHTSITMVEVQLQAGAGFEQDLPADYNGLIVVLEGSGAFGAAGTQVKAGQLAWLTRSDTESIISIIGGGQGLRAIVFAGQPLREPIAARGPFVMNTMEELDVGFAEFRRAGDCFGL